MKHEKLRDEVCQSNLELVRRNLIIYSWGNVSGIDREAGVVAIKPSGVNYDNLTPDKIVLLDLEGQIVEGSLNPSSDTPTHLELYRHFESIGGITHTHSTHATMWAQAGRDLPCLGTTHADNYYGTIPCTKTMTPEEMIRDYELNTGKVIVREFLERQIDPDQMPAVLVAHHGPFTWGGNAAKSVEYAVILEETAKMASGTLALNPGQTSISQVLLDKHYLRKHGKNAYYGQ